MKCAAVVTLSFMLVASPAYSGMRVAEIGKTEFDAHLPNVVPGALVKGVVGDSLTFISTSYVEASGGYVPTFVITNMSGDGRVMSESQYQTQELRQHKERPFIRACRCANGDIIIAPSPGSWNLVRLDSRGELVSTKSQAMANSQRESFVDVVPDRGNGAWLATTLGGKARLYRLNEKNEAMLQMEYSFGEYTVILDLVRVDNAEELVMCGLSGQVGGPSLFWIAAVDSAGQVVNKTEMPSPRSLIPANQLDVLPNNRIVLVYEQTDDEARRLYSVMYDEQLRAIGQPVLVGDTRFPGAFSISAVDRGWALLTEKLEGGGLLLLFDEQGERKESREVPIRNVTRHSLEAAGSKLYVGGPPDTTPGKSIKSSAMALCIFDVVTASQPAR